MFWNRDIRKNTILNEKHAKLAPEEEANILRL
jgi:hypothetical protein